MLCADNMSPSTNGINGHVNGHTNGHVVELQLGDFCIDEYKPLKVIVIGAGFSGIAAGIRYVLNTISADFPSRWI